MFFIRETKPNEIYNALLDVESVARDSWSPPAVHGWEGMFHRWGPHPWIYPQVAFSIFKNPQAFISSLSVALFPSFHTIGPPHPWIFTLFVGYPRVTVCAKIHGWGLSTSRVQHLSGMSSSPWVDRQLLSLRKQHDPAEDRMAGTDSKAERRAPGA